MPQPEVSAMGRRRFIAAFAVVMGGGIATVVGAAEGAKADDTVTLWRLNANWGYPVGPKDKTRCDCKACQLHAANKIFLTQQAAIAGRIHLCCVCQPESFVVPASCVGALFSSSPDATGQMTDRRYDGVGAALASCFAAPPPTSAAPSAPPGQPSTPPNGAPSAGDPSSAPTAGRVSSPTPAIAADPSGGGAAGGRAGPSGAVQAEDDATLPVTGIDLRPIAVAGGCSCGGRCRRRRCRSWGGSGGILND